jgi:hypothetical protein
VQVRRARENVFTLTATSQELSALVAGARMARDAMRASKQPPPEHVLVLLDRVLADYDRAFARLGKED